MDAKKFNKRFNAIYNVRLALSEVKTHTNMAKLLGITYRIWNYKRSDPYYRIDSDFICRIVDNLKLSGDELLFLFSEEE